MLKKIFGLSITALLMALAVNCASKDSYTVTMHQISALGIGSKLGTIIVTKTASGKGIYIKVHLHGLTPGEHGFHIHENPSCAPGEKNGVMVPGLKAGGHFDPGHTGKHRGPFGHGHLGDLPFLVVDNNGFSNSIIIARRPKLSDLKDRSLMIHAGGDNYTDHPPMGGGGMRVACGVIN